MEANGTKQKQKESKLIERKPVVWPLMQSEVIEMVSAYMKDKYNVEGHDWNTNIPKGILNIEFIPGGEQ